MVCVLARRCPGPSILTWSVAGVTMLLNYRVCASFACDIGSDLTQSAQTQTHGQGENRRDHAAYGFGLGGHDGRS
jgi:hypothetical protein